ncbi:hypothetical protein OB959_21590 [Aeromonas bestiarum]|uniref:Uncharacterized protein n=1 Tax=Aeromonas bestiarum TaxID=105751 RepID=A0AAW7I2A1_9GAMM|nr:hypothetical protein [Aeromonas bestiarum]MDM5142359.1 hypothetical protein [Aeromonas bestiarum]
MDRLDQLFDAAGNLLAASEKNEKDFIDSIRSLNRSIHHVNEVEANAIKAIEKSTKIASEEIVERVSGNLLSKLKSANIEAEKAALRYERASRYSVLKLSLIVLVLLAGVSVSIWFLFIKNIPTIEEIKLLKAQSVELQRQVDKLKQYGDISECDGKICVSVKVDKYYTSNDEKIYYVVTPK